MATKDPRPSIAADPQWFIGAKPETWFAKIVCGQRGAIRIATNVTKVIIPEWIETQPGDKIPLKVIEAVEEATSGITHGICVSTCPCSLKRVPSLGNVQWAITTTSPRQRARLPTQ
jgi:hypothetical protein